MKYLLFRPNENGVLFDDKLSLDRMYELIECDYIDIVRLAEVEQDGKIFWYTAIVDDCGQMVDKPIMNRGFYGSFIVSKVNEDGEDVTLLDNEVDMLLEKFKIKDAPISETLKAINYYKENIDNEIITKDYPETKGFANIITCSTYDVLNDLERLTEDREDLTFISMEGIFKGINSFLKMNEDIYKENLISIVKELLTMKMNHIAQGNKSIFG